jgi:hypothetical protein
MPHQKTEPDHEQAERLRNFRKRAGFSTAADCANAMGISWRIYQHHESGRRVILQKYAEIYAKFFGTTAANILFGALETKPVAVPIVGSIADDGQLTRFKTPILRHDVTMPPIEAGELNAVIIETRSLWPSYRPGDVLFFPITPADEISNLGIECIVELSQKRSGLCFVLGDKKNPTLMEPRQGGPPLDIDTDDIKAMFPIVWVKRNVSSENRKHKRRTARTTKR